MPMTGQVTDQTVEDAQKAAAASAGQDGDNNDTTTSSTTTPEATAESLGVTEEQFAKFFDKEKGYNWQAHAKEAEFKLVQKAGKADDTATGDNQGEPAQVPADDEGAKDLAAKAGIDWKAAEQSIIENQDLSAEDRAKLEKIGIPGEIVDQYVEGLMARVESHLDNVYDALGGEQGFQKVSAWAKANLSEGEIQEMNEALSDPEKFKFAAEVLLSRAGLPPVEKGQIVQGHNQAAPATDGSVKPYASEAEMQADISNPEYRKDAAFRANVMARARASNFQASNPRAHTAGL